MIATFVNQESPCFSYGELSKRKENHMTTNRSSEIWNLLINGKKISSLDPPATQEEKTFFEERKKILENEQQDELIQKRMSLVYQLAINDGNLTILDPPATQEEINIFNEIVNKTAQAKQEGRTIIWEIPFDIQIINI